MLEKNTMGRICFQAEVRRAPRTLRLCRLAPLVLLASFVPGSGLAADRVVRSRTTVRIDRSSGRLVRTQLILPREVPSLEVIAKQAPGPKPLAAKAAVDRSVVDQIVEEAAARHEVDPLLAKSVLAVESAYNQFATSPKGAMGYMQLMPGTARQLGVANAYDARQNIEGGVRYLRYLKSKFDDERLVLAAYNAGEGAVKKHGWIPPYPETIDYVYKVGKRYGEARRNQSSNAASSAKEDSAAARTEPKPEPRIAQAIDAEGRIHLRLP